MGTEILYPLVVVGVFVLLSVIAVFLYIQQKSNKRQYLKNLATSLGYRYDDISELSEGKLFQHASRVVKGKVKVTPEEEENCRKYAADFLKDAGDEF